MKQKIRYKKGIRIKYWFIRHRIMCGVILLVLGLIAFGIIKHIDYNHKVAYERNQFARAKVQLDNIYDQLIAAVGQPLAHSSDQYCSRTSTEAFAAPGALSCDIVIQASFKDNILKNKYFNAWPFKSYKSFSSTNETKDYSTRSTGTSNTGTPSCYYHFWIGQGDQYPYDFKAMQTKYVSSVSLIEIGCGGGTLTNYYPLKKM